MIINVINIIFVNNALRIKHIFILRKTSKIIISIIYIISVSLRHKYLMINISIFFVLK